jgi:hypothetical protein
MEVSRYVSRTGHFVAIETLCCCFTLWNLYLSLLLLCASSLLVQRQVALEFGFQADIDEGIDLLRSALSFFPNDPEVKNATHYLRNNIVAPCPVAVGETIPNVLLHSSTDNSSKSLHQILAESTTPTVLVAGSYT